MMSEEGEDAPLPDRQSIRKQGWDYSTPGWYFVTCNTHNSHSLFGMIVKGKMVLNEAGKIAQECWAAIPTHFPTSAIGEYVIMPNHVHGLVRIRAGRATNCVRASNCSPLLGTIIGAYKSAVSRNIGRGGQLPARTKGGTGRQLPTPAGASPVWHRNYWDVIVQDDVALCNIRRYIRDNPANYDAVLQCGDPQMLGNAALLDMPKVGFLASRGGGGGQMPAHAADEAIISGFLSPLERQVFWEGLRKKIPLVWVKPWGLTEGSDTPTIRAAIDEGRLLMLSPFDEKIQVPSARRAAWCNEYVMNHCERLIIGYLNPSGMLACLLCDAPPDLKITIT